MGIAGDCSNTWKDNFQELLIIDQLRGSHSTGVAVIKRGEESETLVVKRPGPPQEIMVLPEYKSAMNQAAKCVIGHNRYATKGARTTENAHPFDFTGVVGAHNGTLDSWAIRDLHDSVKFDTDSEAIFAHIDKFGLKDALSKMAGAWALTWFDKFENTINFLRNDRRPLFYTYSKDHCTLLWASEYEFLEMVCKRHGIHKGMDGEQIFIVEPDIHYSWKIPEYFNDKFEFPDQIEAKSTRSFQSSSQGSHAGSYGRPWGEYLDGDWVEYHAATNYNSSATSSSTTTGEPGKTLLVPSKRSDLFDKRNSSNSASSNVVPFDLPSQKAQRHLQRVDTKKFRQPYKDEKGRVLNRKEFNRLISQGCLLCGDSMSEWNDFVHILPKDMTGKNQFLCEQCYNEDDALEIVHQLMSESIV